MKILLMLSIAAALSMVITATGINLGLPTWQIILSNVAVGAILGLVTGLLE